MLLLTTKDLRQLYIGLCAFVGRVNISWTCGWVLIKLLENNAGWTLQLITLWTQLTSVWLSQQATLANIPIGIPTFTDPELKFGVVVANSCSQSFLWAPIYHAVLKTLHLTIGVNSVRKYRMNLWMYLKRIHLQMVNIGSKLDSMWPLQPTEKLSTTQPISDILLKFVVVSDEWYRNCYTMCAIVHRLKLWHLLGVKHPYLLAKNLLNHCIPVDLNKTNQ